MTRFTDQKNQSCYNYNLTLVTSLSNHCSRRDLLLLVEKSDLGLTFSFRLELNKFD